MRELIRCGVVLGLTVLSIGFSASAAAQPMRMHGTASAAHALIGHQRYELGWGGSTKAAGELPILPSIGVALELSGLYLTDGSSPTDPTLRDQGNATALSGAVALHFRPFASNDPTTYNGLSGLWSSAGFGVTQTGELLRFAADVNLGYDFLIDDGWFAIGPALGLFHVFQGDSELRPQDANIFLLGLHGMFDTAEKGPADRDRDKIRDPDDDCPDQPEDKDGFEDADGCPEDDNDNDGVLDPRDRCPDQAEDIDDYEDADGCPDEDDDKDGVKDLADKCKKEAEDKDGFEDDDGCPDPDNDGDGVLDPQDLCPNEQETKNGYADEDGCPDIDQVRVVGDRIVLDDRVHFAMNNAIIRPVSYALLSKLARLLVEHPEYIQVAIEGHTDQRGSEAFNQKLSQDRAEAVMKFLSDNGVTSQRLSAAGFGSSRPLVDSNNEYAWYMNRRVEFVVTRKPEASGAPDPLLHGTPTAAEGEPAGTDTALGASEEAESQEEPAAEPANDDASVKEGQP